MPRPGPGGRRFKLTIVMPVFNEAATITSTIEAMLAVPFTHDVELLVVDDGSTDASAALVQGIDDHRITLLSHEQNAGKGAAVLSGIAAASGTHILVFDADDEYDPFDIPSLTAPIVSGRAEVVYGVRLQGVNTQMPTLVHAVGNKVMTMSANLLFSSAISDLHTCLKLLPAPLLRVLSLQETGFGLDTEISAELLRRGFRPFEVPISYVGRSKQEGKKIRSLDAVRCFYVLAAVRLRGTTPPGLRDRSLTPRVVEASPLSARRRPRSAGTPRGGT